MSRTFRNIAIFFLLSLSLQGYCQQPDNSPKDVLYKRERSGFLEFRSNGWGFGYRLGKFKTGFKKKTWDLSFSFVRDIKQIKVVPINKAYGSRYYFGKLIYFYNLKALYGTQKVISTKPYWGGVEIRRFFFGGANLGIGVPVYVYVYNFDDGAGTTLEKFDPQKHDYQDIYGKGPFTKGLSELKLYPALSFKSGLNVEYGMLSSVTKAVEAGFQLDLYPIPVQIMGFKDPSYFMASIYLAFHFGRRYNR